MSAHGKDALEYAGPFGPQDLDDVEMIGFGSPEPDDVVDENSTADEL